MSSAEMTEIGVVWEQVNSWTPTQKIALMHRILDSLQAAGSARAPTGGSDSGPPPSEVPTQDRAASARTHRRSERGPGRPWATSSACSARKPLLRPMKRSSAF